MDIIDADYQGEGRKGTQGTLLKKGGGKANENHLVIRTGSSLQAEEGGRRGLESFTKNSTSNHILFARW